eukprot:364111-Chlamydomonas_euryale.AAC.8
MMWQDGCAIHAAYRFAVHPHRLCFLCGDVHAAGCTAVSCFGVQNAHRPPCIQTRMISMHASAGHACMPACMVDDMHGQVCMPVLRAQALPARPGSYNVFVWGSGCLQGFARALSGQTSPETLIRPIHVNTNPLVHLARQPGSLQAKQPSACMDACRKHTVGLVRFGYNQLTLPSHPVRTQPQGFHYVDTMHEYGGLWSWRQKNVVKLSNQYAAMPSMHAGYSLWCSTSMYEHSPFKALRIAGALYPLFTMYCIVVTANHFLLDAVVGAVVFYVAHRAAPFMPHFGRGAAPDGVGAYMQVPKSGSGGLVVSVNASAGDGAAGQTQKAAPAPLRAVQVHLVQPLDPPRDKRH